jgi:hypothetical protein
MGVTGDVRHSLQSRLKSAGSNGGRTDVIRLALCSGTAPPLRLIDLPGLDLHSSAENSPVSTIYHCCLTILSLRATSLVLSM